MRPTVWMFAQRPSFSALQRAENSSIRGALAAGLGAPGFQCSSASRKFLNFDGWGVVRVSGNVSVLFSEPKIPQFQRF